MGNNPAVLTSLGSQERRSLAKTYNHKVLRVTGQLTVWCPVGHHQSLVLDASCNREPVKWTEKWTGVNTRRPAAFWTSYRGLVADVWCVAKHSVLECNYRNITSHPNLHQTRGTLVAGGSWSAWRTGTLKEPAATLHSISSRSSPAIWRLDLPFLLHKHGEERTVLNGAGVKRGQLDVWGLGPDPRQGIQFHFYHLKTKVTALCLTFRSALGQNISAQRDLTPSLSS